MKVKFVCETCLSQYDDEDSIYSCTRCGREICDMCQIYSFEKREMYCDDCILLFDEENV